MRYKLTLKLFDPHRNILPVNYQFELGSWFYRMVNQQDSALHAYLVSSGYVKTEEPFRNYVFSHLMVPDRKIEGDRLLIQSERVGLIFSTIPDESLAPLVIECFKKIHFLLGDRISQVSFLVETVERLPDPDFTDKMTFKTVSPLHLTMKVKDRKNEQFLSPEISGYARFFYENLQQKFRLLNGFDHPHDPLIGKFKLRSPVTQKGITVHSGNSGQNKLIGYQLRFRLQADPELLKVGYYLGFGEKNHLGFGCCEIL
ncbi:MAG: CRISPR-associated endoribonuclease Cas6 [Prolixibacteraceae bacterium]|nr:CRISPR-associated endoribonuclease Cas6 [Prolixibacteraceae bacterium]